jgi:hypothetical protein
MINLKNKKMALEFKKYEGGPSTLTDLGSVKSIAGKGGKIAFIRSNFNNLDKRVAVLITNGSGDSDVVSCSQQVSDALRNKQMNIAQLASLSIVETVEGNNFIVMPTTGGLQEFSLDAISAVLPEMTTEFLPEELVAF